MALMLPSSASSFATKHLLLLSPPHNLCSRSNRRSLIIKSQDPSSTLNSSESQNPTESPPPKKTDSAAGLGFGSSTSAGTNPTKPVVSKKKQKGKKERASIIRRVPVEIPSFASQNQEIKAKEQSQNESAFLLAWLGLGAIILVEGIALAASGFLPEEWDNFFVKYLYPSFTPTVFLFVAGTVAYGVLKYLENEKFKSDS